MEGTAERAPDDIPRAALEWLACKPWRAFLCIFILSFSLQGFLLTRVPEQYVRPHTGREAPAIAVSLAERGQFADPYALPTGPTAHLPPIPPAILGLTYKLFGLTSTAGYVAWLVNFAVYAAVWGSMPWVAGNVGLDRPAGVLAGITGALTPRWSGHGEGMAALALGLLMTAFARRWISRQSTAVGSLLLGAAAGVAFHVQPAILPVVLGWMAFELWWSADRRKWRSAALLTLGMSVACLPWAWRNYQAFEAVFFIRSNFGLELRMGNHAGADAAIDMMDRRPGHVYIHPRALETEARKVQELGEVVYMRRAGREALDWIATHPGRFIALTAWRAVYWWFGPLYDPLRAVLVTLVTILALLGAWLAFPSLAAPQRAALLSPLLMFPLVYYIVAYMPRYREPIDWAFLLLAGTTLWHPLGGRRRRRG